jgi:hypothetical protein
MLYIAGFDQDPKTSSRMNVLPVRDFTFAWNIQLQNKASSRMNVVLSVPRLYFCLEHSFSK